MGLHKISSVKNKINTLKYLLSKLSKKLQIYFLCCNPFYTKINYAYQDAVFFLNHKRFYNDIIPEVSFINESIDLSIIIPVFNAEKYITNCIKSVITQITKFSFELIIINDGSSDNSLKLIKDIDSDVVSYYSTDNNGAAAARNLGLSKSSGKHIMFVDADDELLPGALEILMHGLYDSKVCIVQGNFYYHNENKRTILIAYNFNVAKKTDLTRDKSIILTLDGYPWAKIYKRDLFANAIFPHFTFEDTLIWLTIYRRAKNILTIPIPVYKYNIQNDSETARILSGSFKGIDSYYVVKYLIKLNIKLGIEFDEIFYRQLLHQFGELMYRRNYKSGDDILASLMIVAKDCLSKYNDYCPKHLDDKERKIKYSIEKLNLKLYKTLWS